MINNNIKNITTSIIGSLLCLPKLIFTLLKNINKINLSDVIIIHFGSGYGHHFTHHDLARYYFKKKNFLYIHFFESGRHNTQLGSIFDSNQIIILNNFTINLFNKKIKFGEYEKSLIKPLYRATCFFVKLIKKKDVKMHHFPWLYNKINNTFKKLNIKKNYATTTLGDNKSWLDFYYSRINKYKNNQLYKLKKNKKLKHLKNENNKICCIYLRYFNNGENFQSMRSGSKNIKDYLLLIDYLISKKYLVYLIGDNSEKNTKDLTHSNLINLSIYKKKQREQLELYALSECELFISEAGGCQYFGLYSNKTLLINYFPINYPYPAKKLNKKIFDLNTKKAITIDKKIDYRDQINMILDNKNLILENNKPDEILNFVKENIND